MLGIIVSNFLKLGNCSTIAEKYTHVLNEKGTGISTENMSGIIDDHKVRIVIGA